jgi:hypothetical protein
LDGPLIMKPLLKVPVIYGAIAGILGFFIIVILYYLGYHPFGIPVHLDFRIFLFGIFIFFSLKEVRDIHNGGVLYFWEGSIASFLFVLAFGIISSILIAIFTVSVPEFLDSYIRLKIDFLKNLPVDVIDKIGKDVVESNLKSLPATNAFDLITLYFWQSLMIGAFISIILSVILRKQPKT